MPRNKKETSYSQSQGQPKPKKTGEVDASGYPEGAPPQERASQRARYSINNIDEYIIDDSSNVDASSNVTNYERPSGQNQIWLPYDSKYISGHQSVNQEQSGYFGPQGIVPVPLVNYQNTGLRYEFDQFPYIAAFPDNMMNPPQAPLYLPNQQGYIPSRFVLGRPSHQSGPDMPVLQSGQGQRIGVSDSPEDRPEEKEEYDTYTENVEDITRPQDISLSKSSPVSDSDDEFMPISEEKGKNSEKRLLSRRKALSSRRRNHLTYSVGRIRSVDHYHQILREEENNRQQTACQNEGEEGSFPNSESEQRKLVKALFKAIMNDKDIIDKPDKNGKVPQAVTRIVHGLNGGFDGEYIERICWQLLIAIRDASFGAENRLLRFFSTHKYEEHQSFEDRFNAVIEALSQSKALAKQLLDNSYVERLAEAPSHELGTKLTNLVINAKRNEQNSLGRAAAKMGLTPAQIKHIASQQDSEDKEDEGDKETIYTPLKSIKKRNATTGSSRKRKASSKIQQDSDADSAETPTRKKPRAIKTTPTKGSVLKTLSKTVRDLSITTSPAPTTSVSGFSRNPSWPQDTEDDYKKIICRLLEIDVQFAEGLSLNQLRTYARAYNGSRQALSWVVRHGDAQYDFVGPLLTEGQYGGIAKVHLAHQFPEYEMIAQARQDLVGEDLNEEVFHANFFHPQGILENRALGVISNRFGLFVEE